MGRGLNIWQKKQQEKKKVEKISTLRKYAKLLKKENIKDSKRIRIDKSDTKTNGAEKSTEGSSTNELEQRTPQSKPKRYQNQTSQSPKGNNPKDLPTLREAKEQERQRREQENSQKIAESKKRRKQERKALTQKTKKGQPVLKGHIQKILGKLINEQS